MKIPVGMVVDGTGLLVRCSRAAAGRRSRIPVATSSGIPTGTLLMFAGSLARKVRIARPGYLAVAWDGPDSRAWRQKIYPPYKAGRSDFNLAGAEAAQAAEFCAAAGIAQWTVPGFEADDLLASAARNSAGVRLILASDDADVLQLAGGFTAVLRDGITWTAQSVQERWGVAPGQMTMLRALSGDPGDGISGLPGSGPASALRMLKAAGFRWPLPQEILPEQGLREIASACYDVMDLRDPVNRPEFFAGEEAFNISSCAWNPSDPANMQNVRSVLVKYELGDLAERSEKGNFW